MTCYHGQTETCWRCEQFRAVMARINANFTWRSLLINLIVLAALLWVMTR